MAQTKTSKSRSSGSANRTKSSSSSRSNGTSTKKRSSRGSGSSTTKRAGSASASKSGSRKRTNPRSSSSSKRNAQSRQGQNGRADKSTVESIVEKAKAPAMAGGAALLGLAGGLAVSRKQRRKGVFSRMSAPSLKAPKVKMPKLSAPDMPKPGTMVKAVGSAAGQVADRSTRLGQIAAEVQKASDAIANGSDRD
jgi:hypothetical protein